MCVAKRIVIRTDASLQIGTGHVMRCLTLAQALKAQGHLVEFICRNHSGNLISLIEDQGFSVFKLISEEVTRPGQLEIESGLFHAQWLGVTQQTDAAACKAFISNEPVDWLIVDHYGIDYRWQTQLKGLYKKLLVIDDLADRKHICDCLLDQTFGRKAEDYVSLVPQECHLLLGSKFALLRPEFSQWREYSLARRVEPTLKNLLITMGGVDADNVTGQVLEALKLCILPEDLKVTVIMGALAPHLQAVKHLVQSLSYPAEVKISISNMAEVMANSDLIIGAAGATSWERCCLGVPTIMLVLADNQKKIANSLREADAIWLVEGELSISLPHVFKQISPDRLQQRSQNAATIVDGLGCSRVVNLLGVQ